MVNVVVLAGGELAQDDPLVELLPEKSPLNKVFLPLDGKPVLQWVLDALTGSDHIEQIIVVGRSAEEGWRSSKRLIFLPDQGSLIGNALAGLSHSAKLSPDGGHSLLSSGDIPMLETRMVDWVLDQGLPLDADMLYHVISDAVMEEQFPGSNRTFVPMKGVRVCGGDMHIIAHRIIDSHTQLWKQLAAARKSPLKQASIFGPGLLISILLRRYDLETLARVLSRRLDMDARAVLSPFAALGMDVDKPAQYRLALKELTKNR